MREILFRGFHECEDGTQKALYNGEWHTGEWVYGDLSQHKSGKVFIKPHYQSATNSKEVAPETVCQYTGLTNKNENKIFEGDIVKVFDRPRNRDVFGLIKFGIFAFNVLFYIDWEKTLTGSNILRTELGYWHDKIKIIGNKFENSELVEVEE